MEENLFPINKKRSFLVTQVRSLMDISDQLLLWRILTTLAEFLLNPTRIRCRYCDEQGAIDVGTTHK
jgi:hypothetical protein